MTLRGMTDATVLVRANMKDVVGWSHSENHRFLAVENEMFCSWLPSRQCCPSLRCVLIFPQGWNTGNLKMEAGTDDLARLFVRSTEVTMSVRQIRHWLTPPQAVIPGLLWPEEHKVWNLVVVMAYKHPDRCPKFRDCDFVTLPGLVKPLQRIYRGFNPPDREVPSSRAASSEAAGAASSGAAK